MTWQWLGAQSWWMQMLLILAFILVLRVTGKLGEKSGRWLGTRAGNKLAHSRWYRKHIWP